MLVHNIMLCPCNSGTKYEIEWLPEFEIQSQTESQIQSRINFKCETESEPGTNFCVAQLPIM